MVLISEYPIHLKNNKHKIISSICSSSKTNTVCYQILQMDQSKMAEDKTNKLKWLNQFTIAIIQTKRQNKMTKNLIIHFRLKKIILIIIKLFNRTKKWLQILKAYKWIKKTSSPIFLQLILRINKLKKDNRLLIRILHNSRPVYWIKICLKELKTNRNTKFK